MANDFLSELGRRAPQIALGFLAAAKGGPQAATAFQGGIAEAQQRQEALTRQAQMDEERRQAQAFQEARLSSADARAEEAARLNRLQASLGLLDQYAQQQAETAPSAEVAENALLGRATALEGEFGVTPGFLAGSIPPMAPAISRRQKKQAEETYARAEKTYGPEAMANDSITLTTEAFGQVKPSQLRAMFAPQATLPTGAPAMPALPVKPEPRPEPGFTLNEGDIRFDATGKEIARGAPRREPRQPAGPQAPIAIIDPKTGQPVYVPPSQALGMKPASARNQGRPVTAGDAARIAELDTSLDDLDVLERDLGKTGTGSKLGAMMPNVVTDLTGWGADSKSRQAVIDRVKQVIGKALEGGVLRKEDEIKYEKILPTIGDEQSVAARKIKGLREAIIKRRERELDAREDAGYDVSKFRQRTSDNDGWIDAGGGIRIREKR